MKSYLLVMFDVSSQAFYRTCFDDVALMKSKCFNRNAFKKRVSTAKQRKWIIKIIRFYAAQIATEVKCHSDRCGEPEWCDAFSIETEHLCVCIHRLWNRDLWRKRDRNDESSMNFEKTRAHFFINSLILISYKFVNIDSKTWFVRCADEV